MLRHSKILVHVLILALCLSVDVFAQDAAGRAEASKLRHRKKSAPVQQTKPQTDKPANTQTKPQQSTPSAADENTKDEIFTYRQTGGFIGARRLYEEKLQSLPEAERTKLKGLIKDSGLLAIKGEKRLTEGACDVFYYDFTLKDGMQTHHAVFDDTTLPDSYRPLVNYLKDKVKDEKRPTVQSNDTKQ